MCCSEPFGSCHWYAALPILDVCWKEVGRDEDCDTSREGTGHNVLYILKLHVGVGRDIPSFLPPVHLTAIPSFPSHTISDHEKGPSTHASVLTATPPDQDLRLCGASSNYLHRVVSSHGQQMYGQQKA